MPKRFMIFAEPRSGSGHLARFFAANVKGVNFYVDQKYGHYELFNSWNNQVTNNHKQLLEQFYLANTDAPFLGAKSLLIRTQMPRSKQEFVCNWLDQNDVKIILLKRRDCINQIVSFLYAATLQAFHNYQGNRNSELIGEKVHIPIRASSNDESWRSVYVVQKVYRYCKAMMEEISSTYGERALTLTFLEPITDEGKERALDFIGYDPNEHGLITSEPLEKKMLSKKRYEDVIENYEEIIDFLVRKGWTNE